jgi:hypothetical protein
VNVEPAARDEIKVDYRARWRDHQSGYPRFAASAAAVGCGPIVPGRPLTPRQQAYMRELDAFEASGALSTWEQKEAALEAERLSLHAQALPLDAASEAGDLLELLEDVTIERLVPLSLAHPERHRPGLRPPAPTSPALLATGGPPTTVDHGVGRGCG